MKIEAINLNGIRRETATELISTLLSDSPMTRTRLAELCGVSAMTAGKAVKELLERGIIKKETDGAELFYPSELLTVLTLRLCEDSFFYCLCDLSGSALAADRISRNSIYAYEEDILRFFRTVSLRIAEHTERKYCIGALIVDATPKNIREFAENAMDIDFSAPISSIRAISKLCGGKHPNETALLVSIGDYTDYTLMIDGAYSSPAHANHREITELDELEIINRIVKRVIDLSAVTLPKRILVTSDRLRIDKKLIEALKEELKKRSPAIYDEIKEISGNTDTSFEAVWAVREAPARYAKLFVGGKK